MMTFTIIMIPNCIIITIIMTTITTMTIIITTIIFMTTDWFSLPVEITKYLRLLKHKASKRLQNCFYQNHPNHQQPWHHYQQCGKTLQVKAKFAKISDFAISQPQSHDMRQMTVKVLQCHHRDDHHHNHCHHLP